METDTNWLKYSLFMYARVQPAAQSSTKKPKTKEKQQQRENNPIATGFSFASACVRVIFSFLLTDLGSRADFNGSVCAKRY